MAILNIHGETSLPGYGRIVPYPKQRWVEQDCRDRKVRRHATGRVWLCPWCSVKQARIQENIVGLVEGDCCSPECWAMLCLYTDAGA